MDELKTGRQRRFVEAYLQCWNASEAARQAGYNGQSNVIGPRLLAKDSIKAAIERRMRELKVSTDEILVRLTAQARGNLAPFFKIAERWTENPLPTQEIVEERDRSHPLIEEAVIHEYRVRYICLDLEKLTDPQYAHLVKKFTDSPRSGLGIELYSAQTALELLGKAAGIFTENVNVHNEELAQLLREWRQPPEGA